MIKILVPGVILFAVPAAFAAIVFDNFNTNEGHFGYAPTFAAQSVGDSLASTADRITLDALEGGGAQLLHLEWDGSASFTRIRHLSGNAPYNSANAGTPVGNTGFSFTTGAGEDGFIGFYAKTTATDWQVGFNLDGPGGTGGEMDGGIFMNLVPDGAWHLYEWDLDSTTQWGAVSSIGGGHGGGVADGIHTVDSIYIRDNDGAGGVNIPADIYLDFVAKSDSGSIANLLTPEPASAALILFAGAALVARRRRI